MVIGFESESAKKLFLKYAIPCGHVLVERGDLKKEKLAELGKKLMAGERIDDDLEEVFRIGVRMCFLIAKKLGKDSIDEEVIRRYFWKEHEEAIKWRASIYPDVKPEACRIYAGRITGVGGGFVEAETPKGTAKYRRDFIENPKENDFVILHYGYAVEKITEKEYKTLRRKFNKQLA